MSRITSFWHWECKMTHIFGTSFRFKKKQCCFYEYWNLYAIFFQYNLKYPKTKALDLYMLGGGLPLHHYTEKNLEFPSFHCWLKSKVSSIRVWKFAKYSWVFQADPLSVFSLLCPKYWVLTTLWLCSVLKNLRSKRAANFSFGNLFWIKKMYMSLWITPL